MSFCFNTRPRLTLNAQLSPERGADGGQRTQEVRTGGGGVGGGEWYT